MTEKDILETGEENERIYQMSELEENHRDILSAVNVMCRSNKEGFTDTTRLDVIETLLADSKYHKSYDGALCKIYSKVPIKDLPENIVLVSSHVDTVPGISECSSTLNEENTVYRGTYDNTASNAANVIMMLEEDLPENVVFAFTGEEEACNCLGAMEAAKFLRAYDKNLYCVALDVTYEGFSNNRIWSVENCIPFVDEKDKDRNLDIIGEILMDIEPESQTFEFIRNGKKNIPNNMPKEYLPSTNGMYDEAMAYHKAGFPTVSICCPCGRGEMHSNRGVAIKQPTFEGYVLSLTSFLYRLSDRLPCLINGKDEYTYHHDNLIEAYKVARNHLVNQTKEITVPYDVPRYGSYYTPSWYYDNDDDYFAERTTTTSLESFSDETSSYVFRLRDLALESPDEVTFLEKINFYEIPSDFLEWLGLKPDIDKFDNDDYDYLYESLSEFYIDVIEGDDYEEEQHNFCGLPFRNTYGSDDYEEDEDLYQGYYE